MNKSTANKLVALSAKLYERLLVLYPRNHRREFGPPMAQLFHDQCRNAWAESRAWGLTVLWLRVSVDLAKTSTAEHFQNFKKRKSMFNRLLRAFANNQTPRAIFLALFVVVFLLVLGSSALWAFLAPEQFVSYAHIIDARSPGPDTIFMQTQFSNIQSGAFLGQVVKSLHLNETPAQLRDRISLRPNRNSSIILIAVYDKSASQAVLIANTIVDAYLDFSKATRLDTAPVGSPAVSILENASLKSSYVWHNKPRIVLLGFVGGISLALIIGGAGALAVRANRRASRSQAATS